MKKILCIFLTAIMLISGAVILPVSAEEAVDTDTETETYTAPIYYAAQTGIGTQANTRKIRFVSLVPENRGTVLGYEIVVTFGENVVRYSAAEGDEKMESKVVYSSLLADTVYGVETITTQAVVEDMNARGTYSGSTAYGLFVVVIDNIPVDAQFDVRTYVKEDADEPEDKSGCTGVTLTTAGVIGTAAPAVEWATQGGNGTAAYPYVLNQKNFEAFYRANTATNAGTYREIGHCVLESDVVINEGYASEWATTSPENVWTKPIGNVVGGTFDGNGHKISGICMKVNNYENCRVGFFSELHSGVVVENLTIKNSYFTDLTTTGVHVGSIAGFTNGATISNCHSDAIVDGGSNTSYNLGGIVGYINGATTVSDCSFSGKVISNNNKNAIGGIAGYMNGGEVSECEFSGNVTLNTGVTNNMGGVVGTLNSGTVTKCYSEGTVVTTTRDNSTGGIVGYIVANTTISNCVFNGTVSAGGARIGGIAGWTGWGGPATISNCLNLGEVSNTNDGRAAGILGNADADIYINNCINLSKKIASTNSWKNDIKNGAGTLSNCYTVEGYCLGSIVDGLTKLDSMDALKALNLNGWYYVEGYVPSPIEGLLIALPQ